RTRSTRRTSSGSRFSRAAERGLERTGAAPHGARHRFVRAPQGVSQTELSERIRMAATTSSRGGALVRYLLVRLALVIPTVLILVTVVFFFMRVIGDPITASLGARLTQEQLAERLAAAGFDRPLWEQYWEYITGVFRGDFAQALTDRREIIEVLTTNGAATLELVFWALTVAFGLGIPLGRLAARYQDRLPDVLIRI